MDEFIRSTGEMVLPSSRRPGDTPEVMMNGILRSVLVNGGSVLDVAIEDRQAQATVTGLLCPDVTERYGIPRRLM